jgi:hypothetical protein
MPSPGGLITNFGMVREAWASADPIGEKNKSDATITEFRQNLDI